MAPRSIVTAADLSKITSPELAALLLDSTTATKVAVIDVRDSDHIGGHIKGSSWVPTSKLEARIPELIRLNQDKDKVVFHCMLSQQRGPSSALKFMRALLASDADTDSSKGDSGSSNAINAAGDKGQQSPTQQVVTRQRPRVYVLEGVLGCGHLATGKMQG